MILKELRINVVSAFEPVKIYNINEKYKTVFLSLSLIRI